MPKGHPKRGTKRPARFDEIETAETAETSNQATTEPSTGGDSGLEDKIVSRLSASITASMKEVVAPLEKRLKLLEAACSASSAEGGPQSSGNQKSDNSQTAHSSGQSSNQVESGNTQTGVSNASSGQSSHETPISLITGVSDQIRSRIWELKYVELGQLIFKQDTMLRFSPQYHTDSPEVAIHHKASRSIKTVDEWDRAFARFHSILIQKFPHLSESLIAHQQQVRKISSARGDWAGYDESHRRAVSDGAIKWGQINSQLTIEAMLLNRQTRPTAREYTPPSKQVPKGYCWSYHSQKGCSRTNCDYKHQCPRCEQKHSVLACKSKEASGNPVPEHRRTYKY